MKYHLKSATAAAALALLIGSQVAMAQTAITQDPTNSGNITTNNGQTTNGDVVTTTPADISGIGSLGAGASVSVGSTGASAVTSVTGLNADFTGPAAGFSTVDQTSVNTGAISTAGSIEFDVSAETAGAGSTASISASGAGASLVIMGNNTTGELVLPDVSGDVTQSATNGTADKNDGAISNTGTITGSALVLTGDGASVSVSASGASTVVAATGIDTAAFGGAAIGDATLEQTSTNYGGVTNTGSVTVSNLEGDGASVSVSARGASATVSTTTIGNTNATGTEGNTYAAVTQTVDNGGGETDTSPTAIQNDGSITAGSLDGIGSSASVSASGATASFSVASINDTDIPSATTVPSITQTVGNTADVTNIGSITAGGALATGASASISSTGAGSYASFSTVAAAGTP